MFGAPGLPEILIVCFIVLLLFGKRLPGVMRSLGRSVVEFKKGVKGIEEEVEEKVEEESRKPDSSPTSQA